MKLLKKVLLINWLNYSFQEVEFGRITFLTGKNASGKSTLIDAIQLVMLGETNGKFFNQAANEKSGRTLESYLYGYKGDIETNLSQKVMREGGFTSYIALEFFDEEKAKYFTLGFTAQCPKDRKGMRHRWFILHDSPIPETKLLNAHSRPYNFDEFKEFLSEHLNGRYDIYDTNARYRDAELFEIGELKPKYHGTLKKAVPFAPILNIADFITEYICDVRSKIDISGMQKAIRGYSDLENEAHIITEKISDLEKIREGWETYQDSYTKMRRNEFFLSRSKTENYKNEIIDNEKEQQKVKENIELNKNSLGEIESSLLVLGKRKDDLLVELGSGDQKKKEEINRKIRQNENEIERINKGVYEVHSFMVSASSFILSKIDEFEKAGISLFSGYCPVMRDLKALAIDNITSLSVRDIRENFSDFTEDYNTIKSEYKNNEIDLKERIRRVEDEITKLEKGMKRYPEKVIEFQTRCSKELGRNVKIFADVVEVSEEYKEYSGSLEALLGEKRFFLIIHEEEKEIVESILENEFEMDNVGFIFPLKYIPKIGENSFSEALISNNEIATAYIKSVLGHIHHDGVPHLSPDGMVQTQRDIYTLDGDIASVPFLGRNAIKIQLENAKNTLSALNRERANIEMILHIFKDKDLPLLDQKREEDFNLAIGEVKKIKGLDEEIVRLRKELDGLDLASIARLENEIRDVEEEIRTLNTNKIDISQNIGILKNSLSNLEDKNSELKLSLDKAEEEIRNNYDAAFIEDNEPKFIESWKSKAGRDEIISIYERNFKGFETKLINNRKALYELRQGYNNKWHLSYTVVDSEDNKEFDRELAALKDNELPQHIENIEKAKKSARYQMKNDFLSKMSDNIKSVESQIKDFNSILSKYHFGGDTYSFTVAPSKDNRTFYNMFMDDEFVLGPDIDDSLFGKSFSSKYEKELDELFSILVPERNDGKSDAEKERQISYYTDYRAYLTFDMDVTNQYGEVQKLSKNMQYKSGGETQIPFYLSILVSFAQVCRMKDTKGKSTVRLVIFDEAFSKMDGERIRTCLRLLKNDFDLQVIFSAPPEKLKDVIPFTEDIIVAYKDTKGLAHINHFSKGSELKDE